MVAHQRPASFFIDDPFHAVPAPEDAAFQFMEDNIPDLDNPRDPDHVLLSNKHPAIGRLAAAFGVEECLVHDDKAVKEVDDNRLKLGVTWLLVVQAFRWQEGP